MRLVANRYELGPTLGTGGFATVYRARDKTTNEAVAIKVIATALFKGLAADDDIAERFRREALAVSQLRSPNVVRVFDFGKDETEGLYLVMELVDGVTLEPSRLGRVLLTHEVFRAARALLAGLAEAHASTIVHRDIKPANIIVPNGIAGLADLKILDFGIARSERRAQLDAEAGVPLTRESRLTIGTPAYMAPELLIGDESTPASDVYAAGLVLYELLGHTLLFPERAAREQLTARTQTSPSLVGRVPAPLDELLGKMLQRDPALRFADASEALTALVNMETAPIDIDEFAASIGRPAGDFAAPPAPGSKPSLRKSTMPPGSISVMPTGALSGLRVARLDEDPIVAFRTSLHALDLAMLDALGRRERDNDVGRTARAVVLALRLEIDAAAALLEPLRGRSAIARGAAKSILAPRARVATHAKMLRGLVDDDPWLEEINLELGQLFVAIEAALCGPAAMARCLMRADRVLARSHAPSSSRMTLSLAQIALSAGTRAAYAEGKKTWDALVSTEPRGEQSPLVTIIRSLLLGPLAFRTDDHAARASFEHAGNLGAQTGATLFEARSLSSLGGMLVEVPGRFEQGRAALERVTALLLHADAPSLEHLAAHNRGVALVVERQFASAARQFRRAREVAAGEVTMELELLSGSEEVQARLAAGDFDEARAVAKRLEVARSLKVAPREAMIVAIACALVRVLDDGVAVARADLGAAISTYQDARDTLLLAKALDLIFASASGEEVDWLARAAELHRTAEEHGYAPFYWFEATRAFVARLPDEKLRDAAIHAVDRLLVLLGSPKAQT